MSDFSGSQPSTASAAADSQRLQEWYKRLVDYVAGAGSAPHGQEHVVPGKPPSDAQVRGAIVKTYGPQGLIVLPPIPPLHHDDGSMLHDVFHLAGGDHG